MSKRTAFVGFVAVAVLAACSQKSSPPAAPADQTVPGEAREPTRTTPTEAATAQGYDRAGVAGEMIRLIADRPECQPYRDEMQSIASSGSNEPPYAVVKKAREAGCGVPKK